MTKIIETENVSAVVSPPSEAKPITISQTIGNLVYFVFGLLETALLFRLFFKLAGANPQNGFVSWINGLTGVFVSPFEGIFGRVVNDGVYTSSVFEPAAFVAILVYGLFALGFVKLILILSREKEETN